MKELFNQLFRYMFLYLPATRILLLKLSTLLILLQVGKPKFHWVFVPALPLFKGPFLVTRLRRSLVRIVEVQTFQNDPFSQPVAVQKVVTPFYLVSSKFA